MPSVYVYVCICIILFYISVQEVQMEADYKLNMRLMFLWIVPHKKNGTKTHSEQVPMEVRSF